MDTASIGLEQPDVDPARLADPAALLAYLDQLCQVALNPGSATTTKLVFNKPDSSARVCTKFIATPSPLVLFITSETSKENENEISLHVDTRLVVENSTEHQMLVVIKGSGPLTKDKPFADQLRTLTLPTRLQEDQEPYEVLHSLVQLAIAPYFDAWMLKNPKSNGVDTSDARKKIADLQNSLLHLQNHSEIPHIALNIHPMIQKHLDDSNVMLDTTDIKLLNELQSHVNNWIKQVQAITRLSRDPLSGTASQEIEFWIALEKELVSIMDQLSSPGVDLTLKLLRDAKRYHATVSFLSDTGITEALENVEKYNQLMKLFPLDALLNADSLDATKSAVSEIFIHLNKRLRTVPYPVWRALALVDLISKDLDTTIRTILSASRPMKLSYPEFLQLNTDLHAVFDTWDLSSKEFINVAREMTRKRAEKFIPMRINAEHQAIKDRFSLIQMFRERHHEMEQTLTKVGLNSQKNHFDSMFGEVSLINDLQDAYNLFNEIDVLNTSESGVQVWNRTERAYNERTNRIEQGIISMLRDSLATAKTSREMFAVFSSFNALFVRPAIRGAIQEYQSRLVDSVKNDIEKLQTKFRLQYTNSEAYEMAKLRDLPPTASTIMWIKQMERQLNTSLSRMRDILGDNWQEYADGIKLAKEAAAFKQKLNAQSVYDGWLNSVNTSWQSHVFLGPIFKIVKHRANYVLTVNFDPSVAVLFKEVRLLNSMGFSVPFSVSNLSREEKRIYHYAVCLIDSVRIFTECLMVIDDTCKYYEVLLLATEMQVYALLLAGIPLKWPGIKGESDIREKNDSLSSGVNAIDFKQLGDQSQMDFESVRQFVADTLDKTTAKHVTFVHQFQKSVSKLQNQVDEIVKLSKRVDFLFSKLEDTNIIAAPQLNSIINDLQNIVDHLNVESFNNVDKLVDDLNDRLVRTLTQRAKSLLESWCLAVGFQDDKSSTTDTSTSAALAEKPHTVKLELLLRNQVIELDPPLSEGRVALVTNLHSNLNRLASLPMLVSATYDAQAAAESRPTFKSILGNLLVPLLQSYGLIDRLMESASSYLSTWYNFQSLWDLSSEKMYDILGTDISKWLDVLNEIRNSRATVDSSEPFKKIGIIKIDFQPIQVRIDTKYDIWQHDLLLKFSQRLNTSMKDVCVEMENSRRSLERYDVYSETGSLESLVTLLTTIYSTLADLQQWESSIILFRQGQTLLSRNRFQFPSKWLYIDQVDNEWIALQEVLTKRKSALDEHNTVIQSRISSEGTRIAEKINALEESWHLERPTSGLLSPSDALPSLTKFTAEADRLSKSIEMVGRAAEALGLNVDLPTSSLALISEEIADLKYVWGSLDTIWTSLQDLGETSWSAVVPHKIRKGLEDNSESMRTMPARIRQYDAFQQLQNKVKQLVKANSLIAELKAEALQDRHWTKLSRSISNGSSSFTFSGAPKTLAQVWDLQLTVNATKVKEVLELAHGEFALQNFLNEVNEFWTNFSLELVDYKNRCRLIKNWDEIFQKSSEHLNALQAMHNSPYFGVFEETARNWEERLTRVYGLFDVWLDVQRKWVYLEGVFKPSTGGGEIRQILPQEYVRFKNIDTELFVVLNAMYKSPMILHVLNITGIQNTLEHLAEMLSQVQKSLGEFFEQQRQRFGRFYFIGDDHILEIISNPEDVRRTEVHLDKMFPGVGSMIVERNLATGVISKEGESVHFVSPVDLTLPVLDWLQKFEEAIKEAVAYHLDEATKSLTTGDVESFGPWILSYPCQALVLALQITWTKNVEESMSKSHVGNGLGAIKSQLDAKLQFLAENVVNADSVVTRKKYESLVTELIRLRDATLSLKDGGGTKSFSWTKQMRFYYDSSKPVCYRLSIEQSNAIIPYGYEYIGIPDRLVVTPLIEKCFLTMTQALKYNMGGSPFGPAGTGKTETIKALGQIMGRFVLVFCCDESFDFQSIGRILKGIGKIGAWACFDEFNRLPRTVLSAVSATVADMLLSSTSGTAEDSSTMSKGSSIFITMNPGYAGRNILPDNLKRLFRSFFMAKPDNDLIVQTLLFSQGFADAEKLASVIVPLFNQLQTNLSSQIHYDFGLRALKSVLAISGKMKRGDLEEKEGNILLRALHETVVPKLVKDDIEVFNQLKSTYFHGFAYIPKDADVIVKAVKDTAATHGYVATDTWLSKVLQLYRFQEIYQGIMLVGQSGTGKTATYQALLDAMTLVDGVENVTYCIDAKVIRKEVLYGTLDVTTREWTDGLFTRIVRKIVDNLRGESSKRHWIVFDGDVDPEWVENLNSVLDDNRLLTLPNGERITVPTNVRLVFEVENINYATPATVTRCGMIWFNEVIPAYCVWQKLQAQNPKVIEAGGGNSSDQSIVGHPITYLDDQLSMFDDELFSKIMALAEPLHHVMKWSPLQMVLNFNSQTSIITSKLKESTHNVLDRSTARMYILKLLVQGIVWAFAGDCPLNERLDFAKSLEALPEFSQVVAPSNILDLEVSMTGDWIPLSHMVQPINVESHQVLQPDLVIPTVDTQRHETVIYGYLKDGRSIILCGPPGSGKTMSLFSSLRKLPSYDVVGLNFSKETSPKLIIQTLEQHCVYTKLQNSNVLKPKQLGKRLVVFCDEINLPATDDYGTQKVISLLRQMIEHGGFWNEVSKQWVCLENIQFVGACNPPEDAGRVAMTSRFLRHAAIILVDYPGSISLRQIYSTLTGAALKCIPELRGFATDISEAMITVYETTQGHLGEGKFNKKEEFALVYSPRELTRWVRGIYQSIKDLEVLKLDGLLRIWAHEGLRLFHDRLKLLENREWTLQLIDTVAERHFPNVNTSKALERPLLYSNWLTRKYLPVDQEELRSFVVARMKTFCEEEIDKPMVLFDDLLDHVLRIDRVLRQPQGHLILVGVGSSGRTLLTRFVAWMNGIKVRQLKTSKGYRQSDFDHDIREVLKKSGCYGEKTCLIIDESSITETSYIERLNTLLANSEVPGLFEGDEFVMLMSACKDGVARRGLNLSTEEELYSWFISEIIKNLHVVLTISERSTSTRLSGWRSTVDNQALDGSDLSVTTSPALFNRCVVNYMGDWSDHTLEEVAAKLTKSLDLDWSDDIESRGSFSSLAKDIHGIAQSVGNSGELQANPISIGPGFYLDFLNTFSDIYRQKSDILIDQQRHFDGGLVKVKETAIKVRDLKNQLSVKQKYLESKKEEANAMLRQMLADQNEAERKRVASIEIQKQLEINNKIIAERQEKVFQELSLAEPAVLEAQQSVSNIKKQHLTELRSMSNPPDAVKLTLESVCTLLGHRTSSWRDVQHFIRKDDFILSIVNFDNAQQMTPELRSFMETNYLSLPNYNYESVNRASKACGPLLQWVVAHVEYSRILESIEPLRHEVQELEVEAQETIAKATVISDMINELEASIDSYSNEYSKLITETQNIKTEMESVERKVERSTTLLEKLGDEKKRWSSSIKEFESKKKSLAGSCLLSAAFITYSGYFDQALRGELLLRWKAELDDKYVVYDKSLDVSAFMSSVEERSRWSEIGSDRLWLENAIMTSGITKRYPYIIDPNGSSIEFLKRTVGEDKLMVTSFTDASFTKHLESSLRFGTSLLILDAEHYDPVIAPILSKEYRRAGGRTLITLGKQDIDFSTNFRLYMHTRDATIEVPEFVASRTTLVNYTITRNSLQSQSLDIALKSRRPDIEEKRQSMLKMQSNYDIHLHELEMELLDALNSSEGSFLDNDKLVDTLERIKVESSEINAHVSDIVQVMATLRTTLERYEPLSNHAGLIFSVLERLKNIHHVYQFSLQFFVDMFTNMLAEVGQVTEKDDDVQQLIRFLYVTTFKAIQPTLLSKDTSTVWLIFCSCYQNIDVSGLIPDNNLFSAIQELAAEHFGYKLQHDNTIPLEQIVSSSTNQLVALCTSQSNDPSARLKVAHPDLSVVAMGSKESVAQGESVLSIAGKRGGWVLLQNLQLAPDWIESLEKLVKVGGFHQDFRLLYTCDLSYTDQIPTTFLRMSRIITFETPVGIKRGLMSTFTALPKAKLSCSPIERSKVFLALSWIHTVVRERQRLVPIGWTKPYTFDDTDYDNGCKVVDDWMTTAAGSRSNIDPVAIPFDAISGLITDTIYGAKIDNSVDADVFKSICMKLMSPSIYSVDFSPAAENDSKFTFPDTTSVDELVLWVNDLPESNSPACLGLPDGAEKQRMTKEAEEVLMHASSILQRVAS